jgi:hypothetical protein
MRRVLIFLTAAALVVGYTAMPAIADWAVDDGHKMHFPQLPDPTGWDVNATWPLVLADDWECSRTAPVEDIHFWGSWRQGIEGRIDSFRLSIHDNVPASPDTPYSRPGVLLWEWTTDAYKVAYPPPDTQGWYDPASGEVIEDDHIEYFQYNITDIPEPFVQDSGKIYWLNISAFVHEGPDTLWGWKSTEDHFMDDAVWAIYPEEFWTPLYEPQPPIRNRFWVSFDATGTLVSGGGEDAYPRGDTVWFYYPSTEWWNIWFYDHPFDPERYKKIVIDFDVVPYEPSLPSYIEVALNWSTPVWPPGEPPPLPPFDPPEAETLFIERHTVLAIDYFEGPYSFAYTIPDYNPEWVSVDVRGWNFAVEGVIIHECVPQIPVTLDLAFVITGREKVPSLTQWGLIILLVVLAGIATWVMLRRRRVVTA